VKAVNELFLKGKIIGFEEYENYSLKDAFCENSPFRLLVCSGAPISFVVVNPYYVVEDYSFDIEDNTIKELMLEGNFIEAIAVLCVVRPNEQTLYVNLRSPLVINTKNGSFVQTILPNEAYGVSAPFYAKQIGS
jgi:flagellar assembly factor FliW